MAIGVGDKFQNETKYSRASRGSFLDWTKKPDEYKKYPAVKTIKLSKEFPNQSLPIVEALKKRKSTRAFSHQPLSMLELSFLLWAATGVQRREQGYKFRTAPSAGALYPIETYLVVNNVKNLQSGLYHYAIEEHALEELKIGDFGHALSKAALGQEMLEAAPLAFVWTAIFDRSKWKYGQRAYRYVYLDAGHIAQNLALSASGVGLGSCQIAAFFDEEVNQILETDGITESVIYLSVVGYPFR